MDLTLLNIHLDDWKLVVETSGLLPAVLLAGLGWLVWRYFRGRNAVSSLELEGVEFALDGNPKFKLKPNWADRQVAYAIWVELATRKIGLEIDFENDVVIEVYESWHSFFGITRELIKGVPVSKVANPATQEIIRLSVAVLNLGLRRHLTHWQARFRRWYAHEEVKPENAFTDPQTIQQRYPAWEELKADMKRVNMGMINYRLAMESIARGHDVPKGASLSTTSGD